MKIAIIGSPGSGKTWLAQQLANRCELPLINLDSYYFGENWQEPETSVWLQTHARLIEQPDWIIEGNNLATLDSRVGTSDFTILLDLPPWQCCLRILRRWIAFRAHPRPGLPKGCTERFDFPFLLRAWRYRQVFLPSCIEACENNLPSDRFLVVKRKSEFPKILGKIFQICETQ